MPEATRTQYS